MLVDGLGDEGLERGGTAAVNEHLRPLRQRRRALATDPGYLRQVLLEGNARAEQIAQQTLQRVRSVMDMAY